MNERSADLAKLLERLSRVVASLSDEQLEAFLNDKFHLEVAGHVIKPKPKAPRAQRSALSDVPFQEVVAKLRDKATSPEEGERLLKDMDKESLKTVAKMVSLRLNRQDYGDQLIGKIIRQTIGQRDSRDAITGNSVIAPMAIPVQPDDGRAPAVADGKQDGNG